MGECNIVLALLVIRPRVHGAGVRLVVDNLEFFVDEIAFLVLPLGVGLLDALQEDAWTVLVVEIVLLKCEHLVVELAHMVPPLQVFLKVKQVLDILVEYVYTRPPLANYFVDLVGVEVGLRGRVLLVQETLHVGALADQLPTHPIIHLVLYLLMEKRERQRTVGIGD